MSIYGAVGDAAGGHVVTTILIAMVAMLFTAVSYGRMARVYPSAGSAYTYVGKEIHPLAGYVVGWSMLMDYILNPIICHLGAVQRYKTFCRRFPMRHRFRRQLDMSEEVENPRRNSSCRGRSHSVLHSDSFARDMCESFFWLPTYLLCNRGPLRR
jgi:hypothetical protein